MSTYESAYKTLLQGVSQQIASERLDGQNTSQVNMVSDPVTGLRRRPGARYVQSWNWTDASDSNVIGWFTDIAGQRVHILLNCGTGNIRILNEAYVQQAALAGGAYLTNADTSRIRGTAAGNEFFLANCDVTPEAIYGGGGANNPSHDGFFYITSGSFSKTYDITVSVAGSGTYTVSYITPSGAAPGDAALSTPEYIAGQLRTALIALLPVSVVTYISGPYVYLHHGFVGLGGTVTVNTTSGKLYIITSKAATVSAVGDLPARLPADADGMTVRVGSGSSPQYYKYVAVTTEWIETAAFMSPTSIQNVPVSIGWDDVGGVWVLNTTAFEGRAAGDDESNPTPEFALTGITGISTYQGRLVLLAGPLVSLSAAGRPRRFYRSTVTSVLPNDPIEIGSGMNSSAAYEWALPFQKDLLLFSRSYQAVIPSGNAAITPTTATVVPTSGFETDTTSSPINLGRTLMYCNPRSEDFFGAMEMVPSPYTDSQYVSQDATPHLPKYMGGRCRFAVASTVASLALFAPSRDPYSLIVHEFAWSGDTKAQQAWHQWVFPYPVAFAYFAGDTVVVGFVQNGQIVVTAVDPKAGTSDTLGNRRPFQDLYASGNIASNLLGIPAWMVAFDPDISEALFVVSGSGALAGEPVGIASRTSSALTTVLSWPSGLALMGLPYYSGVIPSPPKVTDYQQQVIHSGKATLHRYILGVRDSAAFKVTVNDRYSDGAPLDAPVLAFDSPELELGTPQVADVASVIVPCRTDLRSTAMEVYTEGTGELNITSLEYVAKYNPKVRRK